MNMKKCLYFLFALTSLSFSSFSMGVESVVISPQTEAIDKITLKQLETFIAKASQSNELIAFNCYKNADDKYYIGVLHGLVINESLKQVAGILEDFSSYPQVFQGVVDAQVVKKRDESNLVVQFEDKAPVFFLPNTRYQMFYSIEKLGNKKIYKYHLSNLLKQNDILYSDGLILLKEENGKTFFYELDFFKARWGLAEKVASSKIWPETVGELVLSDFELKVKSENKQLSLKEIIAQSKKSLNEIEIEKCVKEAQDAKDIFKNSH